MKARIAVARNALKHGLVPSNAGPVLINLQEKNRFLLTKNTY